KVELSARIVSRNKGDELSAGRLVEFSGLTAGGGRYVAPIDRTIARLAGASGLMTMSIAPKVFATLIDLVVSTGRLHWSSVSSPVLRRVDVADTAVLAWQRDTDGRQRTAVVGRPSARLLPADPAWYVDPDRNEIGTIALAVNGAMAAALALAPSLNEKQARRVQLAWHRIPASDGVAPPDTGVALNLIERNPVPRLTLRSFEVPSGAGAPVEPLDAVLEVVFRYGERTVNPRDTAQEFSLTLDGAAMLWPRRFAFESDALAKLSGYGFVPLSWPHVRFVDEARTVSRFAGTDAAARSWAQFLDAGVPALRAAGWEIEIASDFPYGVVHVDDDGWDAGIDESEGESAWFELDLGINVEGSRVSLLPVLVDALAHFDLDGHKDDAPPAVYGRLPDGRYVALPVERVRHIVSTLVELFDEPLDERGRLALTPAHVATLERLEHAVPVRLSANAARLRSTLVELAGGIADGAVPVLPPSFAGKLRPYQERGVAWLQTLRRNGLGGVLADDMGLGKTVQLLAHVAVEKAAGRLRRPVLIVAPTSVLPNWRAEIARFVPSLQSVMLSGNDRAERFPLVARSDIALTSYALLHRDAKLLKAIEWEIVVLDEAQFVKNPRSKASQAAASLRALQRLALTGTPIENHLEELWSIFSITVPGLLGERAAFGRLFRTPIEKRGDRDRRSLLGSRLRPFLLRRTKEEVALDLPPKTEIVSRIELDGPQRDLYETIRLAMHKRVRSELQRRGLARSRIVVLDALLKLRQVCCDPRLVKLPAARRVDESSKLEALFEMLPELIDEGRRILLFSQFTSMLDLIVPELEERGISFVQLRGQTRDRETPVRRFQAGEVPLFLISLKAGGTGLNLTAADTVIHYDPWWNPAVERQATDRAHRIGQLKPVFVYKLVTAGTVEERILELQERKGALAAGVFDDAAVARVLDEAEIERLLSA
ncbi:MAG: DEAD/DEAH box helicase, partial [Candidatus Eremiobacteraeota bacterium]|nr:DEAD/DEAH box helicase [Candidatus Eremiobacteraeota bacterium]